MALLLRQGGRDTSQVVPWDQWREVQMAEAAGQREYLLRHPYFPVELRVKPVGSRKGYAREWFYPADFQIRVAGRLGWPKGWIETSDLIGSIHELCFDATGPRLPDAMESIRYMLERTLHRLGIFEPLPDARDAAVESITKYAGEPIR